MVDRLLARAVTVPTDAPESDGTLEWNATTCVIVTAHSGDTTGFAWTYSHEAAVPVVEKVLAPVVSGVDAMSPRRAWIGMLDAVRNLGRQGLAAHAISAVDMALWDLKARLLGRSLVDLWGRVRDTVPVYGSGGFTSYGTDRLREQLGGWADRGIPRVKMKVGREPEADIARVAAARDRIGPDVGLFVDANGAYERKQALRLAEAFHEMGVVWFEEPVSSDDLEGLRLVRERVPAGMSVAAGEYGYHPDYFRRMLAAGAVDVLQADATRCLGYTGMMQTAALCDAWHVPLSAHCCPSLHASLGACLGPMIHVEYFHDHVRIEERFFDGVPALVDGALAPDASAAGHGMTLKERPA